MGVAIAFDQAGAFRDFQRQVTVDRGGAADQVEPVLDPVDC